MSWGYFLLERSLFPLSRQTASQIPGLGRGGRTEEDSCSLVVLEMEGAGPRIGHGAQQRGSKWGGWFSFLSGGSWDRKSLVSKLGGSAALLPGILERRVFKAVLHTCEGRLRVHGSPQGAQSTDLSLTDLVILLNSLFKKIKLNFIIIFF